MKKPGLLTVLALVYLASCAPLESPTSIDNGSTEEKTLDQLDVPDGFRYATVSELQLRISALDNVQNLLKNIPFQIWVQMTDQNEPVLIAKGQTDASGFADVQIKLPATAQTLFVQTPYLGLPTATVALNGQTKLEIVLGKANTSKERSAGGNTGRAKAGAATERGGKLYFMGTFDSEGKPDYLEAQGDEVSQDILDMINATLPEYNPVPVYHPEFIASSVQTNSVLTETADIWVTFVHEGAGYRNTLGYYIYPSGLTPQSAAELDSLVVIFPNISFVGSGGGMHTGDKVYLGRFEAGYTIGWFLIPDGWSTGAQTVDEINYPIRYSNREFNTFTTEPYRSHVVQLADPNRELVLLGFEDLNRPGGDNDFNDAIFYVTVTPFTALDRSDMEETVVSGTDTDNDGVPDNTDEAPNDPEWAFRAFTPSSTQTGTLAFEDLYPAKGDYDMNDMIIDYQFEEHLNAANKIVEIKANFTLRAMGAGYRNGFGIEMPLPASEVMFVTGGNLTENYIQRNANGTESGQDNAVVIVFDNGYNLMANPGGGFVNTEKARGIVSPKPIEMTIKFRNPISRAQLGTAPYNPFLIVAQQRGREIHLPGSMPTKLADTALFGTSDDDTNLGLGKTYLTKNNLPWAINLPESFSYPIEKEAINKAYLKFNEWAQSGGGVFTDWYLNKPTYRNTQKIY